MYKVVKFFTDLQDNNHPYEVGDEYPRNGATVLPSRLKELASEDNRQGQPLIEEIPEIEETSKRKKSADKTDEK